MANRERIAGILTALFLSASPAGAASTVFEWSADVRQAAATKTYSLPRDTAATIPLPGSTWVCVARPATRVGQRELRSVECSAGGTTRQPGRGRVSFGTACSADGVSIGSTDVILDTDNGPMFQLVLRCE